MTASKGPGGLGRVSVVIRVFNEARHIERLLQGILQQTVEVDEIVIVDSGSTDATLEVVSHYPAKVVPIAPEQFSFGRSLNLGIASATGDLIVVASGHVYPVYPDWLEQLLEPFADENVALTYGRQRGGTRSRFSEAQLLALWFPDHSQQPQASPFCNNANAAIRRVLWERRRFREDLPGLEDLDWATWAQSQGYSVAYKAEAEVVHIHEENAGAIFNRYRREAMALKTIRPEEDFRLGDLIRLFVSNSVSDVWHARRAGVLRSEWSSILMFRLMQFWGTFQGFRHPGLLTGQLKRTFYYPRGFQSPSRRAGRDVEPIDYDASLGPAVAGTMNDTDQVSNPSD